MDLMRAAFGVGVTLFMLVAPHIGLPYMQAIPITGDDGQAQLEVAGGSGPQTLARMDLTVGPKVDLKTLDKHGNRSALRVLWAEVDGTKLDTRGQGQGVIKALRFAAAAPAGLLLGDEALELRPSDEVTIEGFEGKWAYAPEGMVGVLRLEGTVLAARLGEKGLQPLGTAEHSVAPGWALSNGAPNLKGNVTVKAGRTAFVSTEAVQGDEVVKHIKARDVKVNGERVRGTKWGEGPLDTVSFLVAGTGVLKGEAGERTLQEGQRLDITDFVGAYVVFFTGADEARVALEGYARQVQFSAGGENPVPVSGNRAPIPGFDWTPAQPKARQAVKFLDRSTDLDGRIVQREWRFGDGQTTTEANPSHAFERAGSYLVTLVVTDNRLVQSTHQQNVTILDVPPTAGWEANPARPSTLDAVQFVDRSTDLDGRIVAWEWAFGDGATSREQHPRHQYAANGLFQVALTVWDDAGQSDVEQRAFEVRNLAPQAAFTWGPEGPLSGQAVQFRDASVDQDGRVVAWAWDFGDGARSSAASPSHAFAAKGPQKVRLVVTDDDGATHAFDSIVDVRNRAPLADFAVSPNPPAEGQPASFQDLSSDADGRIVERVWTFGDGSLSTLKDPDHTYLAGGNLTVSLTVKDDDGARTTALRTLHINRRPIPAFALLPQQPSTQAPVRFDESSVDPDGHIVSWAWDLGDGNRSAEREPEHRYAKPGQYPVSLTVTDNEGTAATLRRPINVTNAPPAPLFRVSPGVPTTGTDAAFEDLSADPDGTIVHWSWNFGDGTGALGRTVNHKFAQAGTFPVSLTVTDEHGAAATSTQQVRVNAAPVVQFGFSPTQPSTASDVQFTDTTTDPDGQLTRWAWDFGDGGTSGQRHPAHRFATPGIHQVRLTVTDDDGGVASVTKSIAVGSLVPVASFAVAPEVPRAGAPVQFTDTSTDGDGEVRAWRWDFGDEGSSTQQHPEHTFGRTGSYKVRLAITDDAGRTAATEKIVRVFAAGPLEVAFDVIYPDGQAVDLAKPGLLLELRELASGVRLEKGGARPLDAGSDGRGRGVLEEGEWAAGDAVVVAIRHAASQTDFSKTITLPADGYLGTIVLRMPLLGRITLAQPAGPGAKPNTFTEPTTQVQGLAEVFWRDGTPVKAAQVTLTYAWEQLGAPKAPVPMLQGTHGLTDAQGRVPFAVPFNLGLPDGPGAYLPGQYRISAVAQYVVVDGLAEWTAPVVFQVDPYGLRASAQDL